MPAISCAALSLDLEKDVKVMTRTHMVAAIVSMWLVTGCGSGHGTVTASKGIYIADTGNMRIVHVDDISGAGWASFGSFGSGRNQFTSPSSVCVGPDGSIYVADSDNARIVRFSDMTGANWTAYGTQGAGQGQFHSPGAVFVGSDGRIYVADTLNDRIVRMDDMAGAGWTTLGTQGNGTGEFYQPQSLFVAADNRIYVADTQNLRVVRIDNMSGLNWTSVGLGTFTAYPGGVWLDKSGRIYIAAFDRISRMDDMAGTGLVEIMGVGNPLWQNAQPYRIAVTQTGKVLFTDDANGRLVQSDDVQGTGWTSLGTNGVGASQFTTPLGIFVQ
jgi:streptogramin lyase